MIRKPESDVILSQTYLSCLLPGHQLIESERRPWRPSRALPALFFPWSPPYIVDFLLVHLWTNCMRAAAGHSHSPPLTPNHEVL
jgi:hypothetical protein